VPIEYSASVRSQNFKDLCFHCIHINDFAPKMDTLFSLIISAANGQIGHDQIKETSNFKAFANTANQLKNYDNHGILLTYVHYANEFATENKILQ
jgi:hypothetical protein